MASFIFDFAELHYFEKDYKTSLNLFLLAEDIYTKLLPQKQALLNINYNKIELISYD